MLKSQLPLLLQQEIRRHDFSYFIDEPPSVAEGGRGVVVPGCSSCHKRIQTMNEFLEHLAQDVLPEGYRGPEALKSVRILPGQPCSVNALAGYRGSPASLFSL